MNGIHAVLGRLRRWLKARTMLAVMHDASGRAAKQPTLDELRARLRTCPTVTLSVTPADAVRAQRGD
jgi:7-keto-8-aminopelargonate synthetase-like enzyme